MHKPKVGDVLFITERRWNRSEIAGTATVTKVGSKYFYTDKTYDTKFSITTWKQITGYSARYYIYPSKQVYDDELEQEKLFSELRKIFSYDSRAIPLERLRNIKQILDGKEDAKEV